MTPVIRLALEQFLVTNEHPEINLFGHIVPTIMKRRHFDVPAAYLALDFISRKPKTALRTMGRYDRENPARPSRNLPQ